MIVTCLDACDFGTGYNVSAGYSTLACWKSLFYLAKSLCTLTVFLTVYIGCSVCDDSGRSALLTLGRVIWEIGFNVEAGEGVNVDASQNGY